MPETELSRATVTLLYKETAQKVDLDTIEKIHLLYGRGIGDLLELQALGVKAEGKESLYADH